MRGTTAYRDGDALANLIDWWSMAGVDTLVADEPRDWRATEPMRPAAPEPEIAPIAKPVSAPHAPAPAAPLAALPDTLDGLTAWLADPANMPTLGPRRCPAQGKAGAAVMLLSDIPDVQDIEAGQLFSGQPGQLLDAMLRAIGLDRETVFLASTSPGRPASGRIEAPIAEALAPAMRRLARLAEPRMLLLMGEASVRTLLGLGLAEARGRVHRIDLGDGRKVQAIASFHPRFLLQQPARKADAWADLKLMMATLG